MTDFMTGMMMGSIISSSSSSAANAASQRERESTCRTVINQYNADTATIADAKTYAGCVETLYPSGVDIPQWHLKCLALSSLLGLVIVFCAMLYKFKKEEGYIDTDMFFVAAMSGLMGALGFPFILMTIGGICYLIQWLVWG